MSQSAAKKRKTVATPAAGGTHITDARFANIQSDPRYKLPGRREQIKVDKRFARALQDDDFSRKAKVDRYGRRVEADAERQRLKRKFDFEEDDKRSASESDNPDADEEVQAELQRVAGSRDILREGLDVASSEDDTSSDEESGEDEDEVDEVGPGLQEQDVPTGEVSSRLAIVNLDWDQIRAEDLMAVFQSFTPATGRLLKVAIYPSEFGKERIEREEMEGPPKEIFADKAENSSAESDEEGDEDIKNSIIKPDDGAEFDSSALRQYQLDRLRYYYAVLTFSSSQTAKAIYDAVDGAEYLSTANFFDLRFIPDETDFSDDVPREECEKMPSGYKPNEFVTDALQHSKVKLTWDADDTTRKEVQARAFQRGKRDIDEDDIKVYLGSDSESDDDENQAGATSGMSKKEAERQRMRALLGLAPEPVTKSSKSKTDAPLGNVQITFSSGLSGAAANIVQASDDEEGTAKKQKKKRSVFENSPEPDETTVDKYVRKERDRKQRRKEKLKAAREDGAASADAETSNAANDEAQEDDLGFEDPFFTEPSHDAKSNASQRKAERLARRAEREAEEAASAKQRAELELLMADDVNDNDNHNATTRGKKKGHTVRHFDMNEIEKAEKAASKKGKKRKGAKEGIDHEAVLASDNFKINTADPRFARLYENHEFAIDPTNARFKGTKSMKALLDEGRKRKEKNVGGTEKTATTSSSSTKHNKKDKSSEIMGLVEKIKRRAG